MIFMRLLVVTQKIDKQDENLGSFHRWIEEFAKYAESVTVITGAMGPYTFPANVAVHTLGPKGNLIRRLWRFWELFSRHYAKADAVFFHMIPEFVLAAAPFLLSQKRPSGLWYVHKSVTWRLKLAERIIYYIFTASALSFRLPSKKVIYTGHAIDTELFKLSSPPRSQGIKLLTVGRISPVKELETIIQAAAILKETWGKSFSLSIVGGPLMPRDEEYLVTLKKLVKEKNLESYVHFHGPRPYTEISALYHEHDVFISMSTTGSLDKAVLEAMASGLTVVVGNEAFREILPAQYFIEHRTPEFLAERIKALGDENRPNMALREIVVGQHGLQKTIQTIVSYLGRF